MKDSQKHRTSTHCMNFQESASKSDSKTNLYFTMLNFSAVVILHLNHAVLHENCSHV
jgi:hypothetical protein